MKNGLKYILSRFGLRTEKKIIIFLSDDWGGLRIKSKDQILKLKQLGFNMGNRFDMYDSLESSKDLDSLYNVLLSYKDNKGNCPKLTALTTVANPNFKKIQHSNFKEFFFETFEETQLRINSFSSVIEYYKKGEEMGVFIPEFHGREHVHSSWWLDELRMGNQKAKEAFNLEYFFIQPEFLKFPERGQIEATYNLNNIKHMDSHKLNLESGLHIFKKLFLREARCFTPPAMKQHSNFESTLRLKGIEWLDLSFYEKMALGNGKYKTRVNYIGKKSNTQGLKYLVRNAVFEPNMCQSHDGVDYCLADIERAFKIKQPAIISNHRAAFMGGICENNRDKGLLALSTLIKKILMKWPDVEFKTVADLNSINE